MIDNSFVQTLKQGLACRCPKCGKGSLYEPGLTMNVRAKCENCGLALAENDSADGPAVFLIFILGFLLVPLALTVDHIFIVPLWAHAVIWLSVALVITLGTLRPLKSYVIALQYKHRPKSMG